MTILLSEGVIATPTRAGPGALRAVNGAVDTILIVVANPLDQLGQVLVGIGTGITLGEGDVPVVSTSMKARDLVSSKLSSIN